MNERLRVLVAELLDLPPEDVTPQMRRADTETWDSMSHLRLITAVETEFGATFTMDEIAALETPQDLQRIIDAHSRDRTASAPAAAVSDPVSRDSSSPGASLSD